MNKININYFVKNMKSIQKFMYYFNGKLKERKTIFHNGVEMTLFFEKKRKQKPELC